MKALLTALITLAHITAASADKPASWESKGLPIFHFSDHEWLELTIPRAGPPNSAEAIEEQRTREREREQDDSDGFIPEELDFLQQLQLRFKMKFR